MAQAQVQRPSVPSNPIATMALSQGALALPRPQQDMGTSLSSTGCFEADRVIKSGYVQKRTQKTKTWKSLYLVLRPDRLSTYKNEKEGKLRHQIRLSDLTAVAFLKDPKQKRQNVFGLFSPSRNFHLEAPTAKDAQEWVDLIRKEARIEEEEEEMFLANPVGQRSVPAGGNPTPPASTGNVLSDREGVLSSSPEPLGVPTPNFVPSNGRRKSSYLESSGFSGNELASHSDLSDNELARHLPGASIESLALQPTTSGSGLPGPGNMSRSFSQMSIHNNLEPDPDRVIWQGWLWMLRAKGGVRQWKHLWGVLRPRNLILYKDGSEYTAQRIISLGVIVNVVDIDPLSKSKTNCFQVITEEKSFRFCAHDEEALVRCIGAFKSLLAKRRELEARAAAAQNASAAPEQQQQQQQQQQH